MNIIWNIINNWKPNINLIKKIIVTSTWWYQYYEKNMTQKKYLISKYLYS